MIIDLILDRKYGSHYTPNNFYYEVLQYENVFNMDHSITLAMDYNTENEVKKALCNYIDKQGYNPEIKKYIKSVSWLE